MTQTTRAVKEEVIGPDFFDDPHKYYRRWRRNGAVFRVRRPNGLPHWMIIGYEESRARRASPTRGRPRSGRSPPVRRP